jgi:signal transduction histidine kinase/CheY-like chemotaxis protein
MVFWADHFMVGFKVENLARRHSRSLDILIAGLVAGGVVGIFALDIASPRGAVDGVGYAALVALCVRFGGRTVIATAFLTSILVIVGKPLLSDPSYSFAGLSFNRGLSIAEIWLVAGVILRRLQLEAYIETRESAMQANQTALADIIREALSSDNPFEERIRRTAELSAAAMKCDLSAVLKIGEDSKTIRAVDVWDKVTERHFTISDMLSNRARAYRHRMESEFVFHTDDILQSPVESRLDVLRFLGVRAVLVADTLVDQPELGAIAFAFKKPHRWTAPEIAFARSVAHLVALLFSACRNAETLATLEQVGEGIYTEDTNGVVRYANRAARALAQREVGETINRFPRPHTPLDGESDIHEMRQEDRDLQVQRIRMPNGGTLVRINDVTARNAANAERRKLEARLLQSAKMEAIGQLAGGVAHDFNNVLGAIMGFAGFLVQDLPERSTERGFAERILKACERSKGLVEQVLAFARTRTVEHDVVDLSLMVKRSSDFLAGLVPPHITVTLSFSDDALPVLGSAAQMGQLVTNLCLNARDSFGDGPGTIRVTARPISALEIESLKNSPHSHSERIFGDWQEGHAYCLLQVEDNGSGIPPEILDRIFEPFFTTKGRHHGTGLGLAVVHGVIESVGAVGHLISSPGKGSVFSIYFPLVNEECAEAGTPVRNLVALRGAERILIVDDEPDITDMLVIGLERLGYETVGVTDPLEALAAFAEQPDAFDVLITDQIMPSIRGLELIQRVKEIRPQIKTILCTGYSESAAEEVSSRTVADAYFNKPIGAAQIASRIRTLTPDGVAF